MEKYTDYMLSLEIRGLVLNKDEITEIVGLTPTEFYNDGVRSKDFCKKKEDIWSHDLWVYSTESSSERINDVFVGFLTELVSSGIDNLRNDVSDVRIHIMINSLLAQIHFPISIEAMKLIKQLDMPIDINIVSMGCIESKHRPCFSKLFTFFKKRCK